MRTVDLPAGFGGGCALAGGVTFEYYGTVEDVFAQGQMEVVCWVGFEAEGLHGREVVDGGEDVGG